MAMKYKNYQETLDAALTTPKIPLTEIEEKTYHANHAVIGYYVASSWRLPKDICKIILQHHERDFLNKITGSEQQDFYAILKLAEHIITLRYHDSPATDWPYIETQVLDVLGIDTDDLADIIEEMNTLNILIS